MENEFLNFDSNFETVISSSSITPIETTETGESPSPVKTDGDNPEPLNVPQEEAFVETTLSDNNDKPSEEVFTQQPKMVEFNETAILREFSNTLKEKSGIEIIVSKDTEIDSFLETLKENIITNEFSNKDSNLLRQARELILDEKGIDEEVLSIAAGIPYGIDRQEYMGYLTIRDFAEHGIDIEDNESIKTLFATYHSLKGISEDDIENYVESDLNTNDINLLEKRRDFLIDHARKGLESIEDRIELMQKSKADFDKSRKIQINEVINTLLKDNEFTKDEIDSYILGTTKKTEEIILPDGIKKLVTPFEKKKYEFSQKNLKDAIRENILFFHDKKDDQKVLSSNKEKAKEAGSFMKNYLKDINSTSEMIGNMPGEDDGFTIVKSSL